MKLTKQRLKLLKSLVVSRLLNVNHRNSLEFKYLKLNHSNMNISELYATNPRLNKTDVKTLETWMKTQPHLPTPDEKMIIILLNACELKLERTKKRIEYYYMVRSNFPELFTGRDPELPENIKLLNIGFMEPLRERSPKGHAIGYLKCVDTSADNYDFYTHIKLLDMRMHILLREFGCIPGFELIVDLEGISWGHWQKVGVFKARKGLEYLFLGYPIDFKAVHFVNGAYIMNTLIAMFSPIMPRKIKDTITVHSNLETLFDVLPKYCIPNHLGGTGGSIEELHRSYMDAIKKNRDYFIADEKIKSDESKRIQEDYLEYIGL